MSDEFGSGNSKKEVLKEMVRRLHRGEQAEDIKEEFKELLKGLDSTEISRIEEELVREGMPVEELHRLCDVHLSVFKESIEKEKALAPPGHPIDILMEEHKMLLGFAERLRTMAKELKEAGSFDNGSEQLEHLNHIAEHFKSSGSHYVREENVLFPYLEKHGITNPPKVMWMEHDQIRGIEKNFYKLLEEREKLGFDDFSKQLEELALSLAEMLSSHFYKENNVLYPTSIKLMSGTEWDDMRRQFDELGYCCFTPEPPKVSFADETIAEAEFVEEAEEVVDAETVESLPMKSTKERMIPLEPGPLSKDELESILNTLPVDISFVDAKGQVRYFNETEERIFPRTKAVIGRTVQNCHPDKSIHVVKQILDDFSAGKRDKAEFWITLNERFIYIRYFPVRSSKGAYLGCLEVTQDLTDLKKLEGTKTLLD